MANSLHNSRGLSLFALIGRGLLHYRRTNVGVILGVAVATAVLTGALMVGDAVRGSLLKRVDLRLGRTRVAVSSGEHFVSNGLARRLGAALDVDTAGVMALRAVATRPDGVRRANRISLYGVDEAFWRITARSVFASLRRDKSGSRPYLAEGVVLNGRLARHLDVGVGDVVNLRVGRPGRMHRDLALADVADGDVVLRLTIDAVVDDVNGGLFSLRAEQAVPMNAFVDRAMLADKLGVDGVANLLLVGGEASQSDVRRAVQQSWRAEDAGLTVAALEQGEWEVRSRSVFIDEGVLVAAALALPESRPVLAYLVNELRSAARATPYSFVAAPGAPLVPAAMPDDGIMVNQWVADDLGVAAGDPLDLRYFVMGAGRALSETTQTFRVHGILPMEGRALDRSLMPAFPGLADVDSCRDWESGLPIDMDRVRDKDEAYWDAYGGAPKAFVTLAAAQAMWRNRYGVATSIRGPGEAEGVLARLLEKLTPAGCGIRTIPVREMGLRAGSGGVDFGQLFLGLSFFIIVAALILTGMLFAFSVEQRMAETGLLMAIGWPRRLIRRLRFLEGACLALPGAVLGAVLGVGYSAVVLRGLGSIWQGAVGAGMLEMQLRPMTLATGAASGAVAAWVAMWLTVRRQLGRAPVEMQQMRSAPGGPGGRRCMWVGAIVGAACWLGVVLLVTGIRPVGGSEVAGTFFGVGALALVGSLALIYAILVWLGGRERSVAVGLVGGGIRAAALRPWHSLGTVALLAAGTFLVIATGANRSGDVVDVGRAGGTGSFAFYAESALPLLDSSGVRLEDASVRSVPIRVAEGDDASCLNLNRAEAPPVWGVDPAALQARGAFSFAAWAAGVDAKRGWDVLHDLQPDGAIPAVADQAVILWGIGKAVGDTLRIVDGRGRPRELRLVAGLQNSLFQGKVLVSEEHFMALFPDVAGYRAFLIESDAVDVARARTRLAHAFRDQGMDVRVAAEHLASFSVVQNTYLAIFLLLGAFGLLLGSAGMGVVAARHILARRGELAMLRAVGFTRAAVRTYVLAEHGAILAWGLGSGGVAGLVAVWPALLAQGTDVSLTSLLALVFGLIVNGLLWMTLAVLLALRGDLVPALREE
ncbi:MAG: ABC transporter permease [Verrucomicrobia bacterium]|jgi:putative ABC transport system permease protein|nr:ABC transporter permease [Verrucomicrobiota bacterium]MBT7065008.1 ABC transporter permease [Verrucomicrobiota bacterium]MBT7700488.1 ABC transporter permease [Verrucomicrobiota bacterium]